MNSSSGIGGAGTRWRPVRSVLPRAVAAACLWGCLSQVLPAIASQAGTTQQPAVPAVPAEETVAAEKEPAQPKDGVLPVHRAWEYSHYRVRIWISSDGSAAADSLASGLPDELSRLGQVCDPSAWELLPGPAPAGWRWRILAGLPDAGSALKEIGSAEELLFDDKLMLISLNRGTEGLVCQVRELDRTTNQWGALLQQVLDQPEGAAENVFGMVRTAFMPLARIDRVTEKNEVYLRARGANLCQNVRFDPTQQLWMVQLNLGSPARVRPDDCFVPVLRKTDRDNRLVSQEPVDFTFIKVNPDGPPRGDEPPAGGAPPAAPPAEGTPAAPNAESSDPRAAGSAQSAAVPAEGGAAETAVTQDPAPQAVPQDATLEPVLPDVAAEGGAVLLGEDYAAVFGQVHSSFNAPLVARRSKRLEKLALVIRPPRGFTTLKLVANDNPKQAMEGIEVWSRPLGAKTDDRSEFIGKTDWRGMIQIPPAAEGLRVIYLKRGARALKKIPIMPGLHQIIVSPVVNDEARLFAEGVIAGMGNEILDVVAQRQIFEKLINDLLDGGAPNSRDKALAALERYRELPKPHQLKSRLADEKSRLKTQTKDKREEEFVNRMFDSLEAVLTRFLGQSRETELLKKIQGDLVATPAAAPPDEAGGSGDGNGQTPETPPPATGAGTDAKPAEGGDSTSGSAR